MDTGENRIFAPDVVREPPKMVQYACGYWHPTYYGLRSYGILASCHKREKLAQCRLALHMPEPQMAVIESVQAFMLRVQQLDLTRCTRCATGVMHVIAAIAPKRLLLQATTGPPP